MKKPDNAPKLRTPGVLAEDLGQPLHRVLYVLRSRPQIRPAAPRWPPSPLRPRGRRGHPRRTRPHGRPPRQQGGEPWQLTAPLHLAPRPPSRRPRSFDASTVKPATLSAYK